MKLLITSKDADDKTFGKHGIDAYYSKLLYWLMKDDSQIGVDLNIKAVRHPDYDVFVGKNKVSIRIKDKEVQLQHDTFLKLASQGRKSIILKELTKQIILDKLI